MAIAEHDPDEVYPENEGVLKMSKAQLHEFAATKEKGLPKKKKANKVGINLIENPKEKK